MVLAVLARSDDAVREAERACELDPLCLVVGTTAAWVRYVAGDYEAAIEHCRRVLDLDPRQLPAQRLMGAAYLQAGRTRDALEAFEAQHPELRNDPVTISWLAHAKAGTGDRPGARALLAALQGLDGSRYLPHYHLASAYAGLGEVDAAFVALEQATVDCDPALAHVAVERRFGPIRSDPRYTRLVDLLGL